MTDAPAGPDGRDATEATDATAVPERYADFAAGRAAPRFTGWLRARAAPTWTDAVAHPFTRDLGAGTLAEDAFAHYLVQDHAFVDPWWAGSATPSARRRTSQRSDR